jgi:uncharacterized protein (TIGR03084 family)
VNDVMAAICADLRAEVADLRRPLSGLDVEAWDLPTPAEGWSVRDQIGHLAYYDEKALFALRDPEAFTAEVASLAERGIDALEREHLARGRACTPGEILDWWSEANAALITAFSDISKDARVVWYGPAMGARSMVTARIMETWAHGQDVRDALGITEIPTGRLRHVCHIAVRARPYAFVANGLTPPAAEVRVELTAPDGEVWTWGGEAASDRVTGSALGFALLATQRRHRADVDVHASGEAAEQWLDIAQAFAGPPGSGREPGQFR